MNKGFLLLILTLIISQVNAGSHNLQNKGFGLGIIIGLPAGLTMRTWGSSWSWDLVVGGYKEDFGIYRVEGFFVHGDLLREKAVDHGQFFFYYGPGLGFVSGAAFGFFGREVGSGQGIGPRFKVGFDYFPGKNWNLFIEVAPSLYIGDFDGDRAMYQVESGIGARYIFR
jgi:hypothetical protein